MVDLGQQVGIETLNAEDIIDSLKFDTQDLSNEDLYELREQEKTNDDGNEEEAEKPTELTSKLLNEIIQNFQYACDFAKEKYPIKVRSSKIMKNILDGIKRQGIRSQKKSSKINSPLTKGSRQLSCFATIYKGSRNHSINIQEK